MSVDGVSSVATEYDYRDTWSLKEKQVFEDYARYLKSEQDRVQLLYNKGPTDDKWPVKPPHPKKLRENKKTLELTKEQLEKLQDHLLKHTCAPDAHHNPKLVVDDQTNTCVFETSGVRFQCPGSYPTLDQMTQHLKGGYTTLVQYNRQGLAWRIWFGYLLDMAFSLHEQEKKAGKRKCTFEAWLTENVGISRSTAGKIRQVSQMLKPYPGFMRLGLAFDEVYKLRCAIEQLLSTPQFADAWKQA